MDFFKSLIQDTDEETTSQNPEDNQPHHDDDDDNDVDDDDDDDNDEDDDEDDDDEDDVDDDDEVSESSNLWSFGGLIQTITTRSESVLETYRRDLQEFGTGLKKETDMFREVATKAVMDLPASIDVAHGAIDGVIKSISHAAGSEEFSGESKKSKARMEVEGSRDSVRFSRFETQLKAIQNDVRTFREEPEDLEEFGRWKLGFALIDRGEEIASLIGEDGVLEEVYKGIVPGEVDNETFWFRYFYRVHKLQQQESVRAKLVKRAISIDVDDEEELSWDVDDDDDDDDDENVGGSSVVKGKGDELVKKEEGGGLGNKKDSTDQDANVIEKEGDRIDESSSVRTDNVGENKFTSEVESASKENAVELKREDDQSEVKSEEKLVKLESEEKSEEKSVKLESKEKSEEKLVKSEEKSEEKLVKSEEKSEEKLGKLEGKSEVKKKNSEVKKDNSEVKKDEKVEKSEEKESLKGKGDEGGLGKEANVSSKPSQQSKVEEEDLEWAEIEDVDSNDEKNAASSVVKSDKDDLRKRLSTVDDDEDLSWDIEDDD